MRLNELDKRLVLDLFVLVAVFEFAEARPVEREHDVKEELDLEDLLARLKIVVDDAHEHPFVRRRLLQVALHLSHCFSQLFVHDGQKLRHDRLLDLLIAAFLPLSRVGKRNKQQIKVYEEFFLERQALAEEVDDVHLAGESLEEADHEANHCRIPLVNEGLPDVGVLDVDASCVCLVEVDAAHALDDGEPPVFVAHLLEILQSLHQLDTVLLQSLLVDVPS